MKIKNCVALVTGAGGGLGRVWIARLIASGAAKVYAGVRDPSTFPETAGVVPVALDVTDDLSVSAAARACPDVSLLINNAGIMRHQRLLAASTLTEIRAEMEANYFGLLRVCRAFTSGIRASTGGGGIINMLSATARMSYPPEASYSASKAAAHSLTQAIRAELAMGGVRVIGVLPGTIGVGMSAGAPTAPDFSPESVVDAALAAMENEGGWEAGEDIYPGAEAQGFLAALQSDAAAMERGLSGLALPPDAAGNDTSLPTS